jgi:pleiotropic regulator 1
MAHIVKEAIDDHLRCTEALFGEVPAIPLGLGENARRAARLQGQSHTQEKKREEKFLSTTQIMTVSQPSEGAAQPGTKSRATGAALVRDGKGVHIDKPKWHPPWELSAVISGHVGWVRSIAFDPSNEWFATGSADRTIKIWDLAKCCTASEGGLKLTLTGHIDSVRALAVSSRHPYLFSAGEDKQVKCWDLETNKVVRHYHGHLSGVFSLALHPSLDVLVTGGRDSVGRVWDMRTKAEVHVLMGHKDAVSSILCNSVDPQVVTASHDSTIKTWDLASGRSMGTLTHHKKGVRDLASSPKEATFVSASRDGIKKWQLRDGKFLKNFTGHDAVINALSVNEDGVCISGGDDGTMRFWDYGSSYCFQHTRSVPQPGSLDAEAGVFASSFDLSGTRFITCESDKSIKIWKEDAEATEETHPVDMDAWEKQCAEARRH